MRDDEYPEGGYFVIEEQEEGCGIAEFEEYAAHMAQVVSMDGKPYEPEELVALEDMALPDQIFSRISFSASSTLAELATMRWLIDGIVPMDSFGVVYGESGAHKSFLVLDMAAHIATGKRWHEFDTDIEGGVLYIAAEGAMGLLQRVVAWETRHGVKLDNKLAVVRMPILADDLVMAEAFRQAAEKASEQMGRPIVMIVVDTLARSFTGDENSAKDVANFIVACDRWRSGLNGATVLVVAHTGKDQTRGIRGSSAIKAACDFSYLVKKTEKLHSVLKCDKSKDGDEPEDMHFSFERVPIGMQDSKGRDIASLVPRLDQIGSDEMDDSTAQGMDVMRIINKIKAVEHKGVSADIDDLRKWFIDMKAGEFQIEPETAGRQWRRALESAQADGKITRSGRVLSATNEKDPWD